MIALFHSHEDFKGGNMKSTKKQRKNGKTIIVPPTGTSEQEKSIHIISQLHGIPEEKIRIDLEKTQLIISASKQNEIVMQKITVPLGSQIKQKKFRNGILEIILERPL